MENLKIGYFAHWFQPPYKFVDFLTEQGFKVEKIDYSRPRYLEKYDVVLIEQNGFNDYIENDEPYFQDWVKRGGVCLFMHQDYARWVPNFLPKELGCTQLIHRYVPTVYQHYSYMMPWIESCAGNLFDQPEKITPDEMIYWKIQVNSFGIVKAQQPSELVKTAALSCFQVNPAWKILGSYMDPTVRDGALILRGDYGKGTYFLNQILFPEKLEDEAERCLKFWRKYVRNLFAYIARFRAGTLEGDKPVVSASLPLKKNYKMAIHMHSLDWYGCDAAPGTIYALMRYMKYDICALAVKDINSFGEKFNPAGFCDDHVMFLNGQEYHPFNWNDSNEGVGHNTYHMLPIGIDPDSYTQKFTRSFFSDKEIDDYLHEALKYAHAHGAAVCATHPFCDFWRKYPFEAVDKEPFTSVAGDSIEKHWLDGNRIAIMNSVDLFGCQRIFDNPAINFLYLCGENPCRDSVVKAIKAGHTMAASGFDEADITVNGHFPGDEVSDQEASAGTVKIYAKITDKIDLGTIREVRIYSGTNVIFSQKFNAPEITLEVTLKNLQLEKFIRVEVEGEKPTTILISTPFYIVKK